MADWRCAAWCDACTTATYAFERVRVVDGLLAVVLWEGAHQRLVAGVRVVVIEQLPVQQRAQLLAAVALVDALRRSGRSVRQASQAGHRHTHTHTHTHLPPVELAELKHLRRQLLDRLARRLEAAVHDVHAVDAWQR